MTRLAVGRVLRFLAVVGLAAGLAAAVSRIPEALARVEAFRVREVTLEGARYLTSEAALAFLKIPADASVWDDLDAIEERLAAHPLVLEAEVSRRLPATLVLHVEERRPVALLPTPALVPVDAEGNVLPVDPASHPLDLPLLRVPPPVDGAPPGRGPVRTLAGEVARLDAAEPDFVEALSELGLDEGGNVLAVWGDPAVRIRFKAPVALRRVRQALYVLSDASVRFPGKPIQGVDLRYDDQVVVRFQ